MFATNLNKYKCVSQALIKRFANNIKIRKAKYICLSLILIIELELGCFFFFLLFLFLLLYCNLNDKICVARRRSEIFTRITARRPKKNYIKIFSSYDLFPNVITVAPSIGTIRRSRRPTAPSVGVRIVKPACFYYPNNKTHTKRARIFTRNYNSVLNGSGKTETIYEPLGGGGPNIWKIIF